MAPVQLANNSRSLFAAIYFAMGCACITATTSMATTSLEGGWARFYGSSYSGDLRLIQLAHEDNYFAPSTAGWITSVSVSQSSDANTQGYGINLDQGLGDGYAVGTSISKSRGLIQQNSASARIGAWWRENTFRTQIEYSRQDTQRDARDYLDTDGLRVRIATDVRGDTTTLRLTHLTTPTTILLGDASQTHVQGRPVAISYGGEMRQYIEPTRSAIHLRIAQYRDRNQVDTTTDFGRVTATTSSLRWNQRLPWHLIATLTGRYHTEREIPRSLDSESIQRQSQSGVVNLKWRYVRASWTEDSSELGVFCGKYDTREQTGDQLNRNSSRSVGVSGRVVI